ncbi:MAG: septal ring lytic transglycosylase RlpA family protein [Microcoleaceae cyanobacterium]
MKHKLWTCLTAFLLFSTVGVASCYADALNEGEGYQMNEPVDGGSQKTDNLQKPDSRRAEVLKVGEYQLDNILGEDTVTKIMAHELVGRQAATLYVRNIPVLTFLDSENTDKSANNSSASNSDSPVKVGNIQSLDSNTQKDPVWRASAVASQLNQLLQNNAEMDITARWDTEKERYMILVNDQKLVEIDDQTILPDTTNDLAIDTLQATNRLRRQVNNAPPLAEIAGKPKPQPEPQKIAVGPVTFQFQGGASWYGPGFHGNLSASGERFNQYAMTAAHKTLPFGTKVRVTNLNNGRSAVVRINDRGPFIRGRVIDVSAAAARVLGMINSGVAPVKVEVIDSRGAN